jgi:sugar O-acyltransferase (sialic acid O-acetyltransferase NeuD family)
LKKLIIIGAGGFGREVLAFARSIPRIYRDWDVFGFLDDNTSALRNFNIGVEILGPIADYKPSDDEVFTCAIAEPLVRLQICRNLMQKGATFVNIISPSATIGENTSIGRGLIRGAFSAVSVNVQVGDFVIINSYSSLGHDAVMEEGCTISAYCEVAGGARVGEGSFLGSHSVILPTLKVGRYAKVGAGSIVVRNVKDGATVFGNPARDITE